MSCIICPILYKIIGHPIMIASTQVKNTVIYKINKTFNGFEKYNPLLTQLHRRDVI